MNKSKAWESPLLYTVKIISFIAHVFLCIPAILTIFGFASLHKWLHHPLYNQIHQYHCWILLGAVIALLYAIIKLCKKKHKTLKTKILIPTLCALLVLEVSIFVVEERVFHPQHKSFSPLYPLQH